MAEQLPERLCHVLWIGGGTDSGKTRVARLLSETYRLPVYHYDRADLRHHVRLAQTSPRYAAFLDASMDQRWVHPEPEALAERAWQAFRDRFALVMEDLTALSFPGGMRVLVEGFGLTPELLQPVLTSRRQAIWLVPTETFKLRAMERRGKGRFGGEVSDAHRASRNLLERDRLLAERIKADARARDMTVLEVDGAETVEAVAARVAGHFGGLENRHDRSRRLI
jgi:hypothetical protein